MTHKSRPGTGSFFGGVAQRVNTGGWKDNYVIICYRPVSLRNPKLLVSIVAIKPFLKVSRYTKISVLQIYVEYCIWILWWHLCSPGVFWELIIGLYSLVIRICAPPPHGVYWVMFSRSDDINIGDYLLSLSCILLVYIEYLSDQQQYEYQEEKWRRKRLGLNLEFPFRNIFNI